jgi:hypothetical protein
LLLPICISNQHVEYALNGNVEGVPSPLSLTHDLFIRIKREQANIWSYLFAAAVVATVKDYLLVAGILRFSIYFFEKFCGDLELSDRIDNALFLRDFARHESFILRYSSILNKDLHILDPQWIVS